MRRIGFWLVVAAVAVGCGRHHTSMEDAVLRYVCGDRCGDVHVRLSNLRRAGDYATAEIASVPAGRIQGDHVLLKREGDDWQFVDAWSSLAGLECRDIARQMQVPEQILHQLGVC